MKAFPMEPKSAVGSMNHVAFDMHDGVWVRSVYVRDPNGIMLEFAAVLRDFRPEDVAHHEPGTSTGTRGDWWTVFALVPDILEHCNRGFGLYRNPARKLDPVLRELAQTRAGWAKASQFVFSQHCKSLRGLGVTEDRIAAIPHWQVADCYDERERAVLAYADCLPLQAGRTPQPVFDALKAFLADEEILELTDITCLYDMHAVMTKALRLGWDDREDPIVEVAAPADFSGRDFLDVGCPRSLARG